MVLSSDVRMSGGILLSEHQVLDDNIIQLIISCGVKTIEVADSSSVPAPRSDTTASSASATGPDKPVPMPPSVVPEPEGNPDNPPEPGSACTLELHDINQLVKDTPSSPDESAAPVIFVRITPDAMSATLIIEPPAEGSPREIDRAMLLAVLAEQEIVFGIDTAAIDRLVEMWSRTRRRYEISNIARGVEAEPGSEGALTMTIRHLSRKSDCDEIRGMEYYWQVAENHPRIDRAFKGKPVAEKQTGKISPPGKNILGAPVFSDEVVQTEVTLKEHVTLSSDGMQAIAQADGIAYMVDDCIGIIPVNFDGLFECSVAPDVMSAEVTVRPPGPGGSLPEKAVLMKLLAETNVKFGILDSDIDTLFALCAQGTYPSEPMVVARGILPQNGKNGTVDYLFNTVTSLAPAISETGRADYKAVNIVNSVSARQQLAKLMPPTEGIDGTDITGKTRPARPGVPARLPQGPHTVADPQHPEVLLAETDGIVRLSGAVVEVCEGFVVPGNVDFSTGNIEYNKSVIVDGDVKSGFTIHCGADLQVNGTIEDCLITVGGNVLCRYGFLGQGKGCIDAKGDVNLGFMKNQTVKSFKNIVIAKESINCTLLSRGSVTVHGAPLSVAGGEVKARTSITVHSAGNHTGIRTLLEAGVDYLMAEELAMIQGQEKTVVDHIKSINEASNRFRKNISGRKRPSAAEQKKTADFIAALRQAQQQLAVLEERKNIVSGKLHPLADSFIRIEHSAYPGTLFKFGERHYLVREEMTGPKTVRYIEHEIKVL